MGFQIDREHINNNEWLENITRLALECKDSSIKVEAAKLLALQSGNIFNILTNKKGDLEEELIIGLLTVEESYPLSGYSASSDILTAFSEYHMEALCGSNDNDDSELSLLMNKLLDNPNITLCSAAAKAYGHIAPYAYLEALNQRIYSNQNYTANRAHAEGLEEALGILEEIYYGHMCPGKLDFLQEEPEELLIEYNKVFELFKPIVYRFSQFKISKKLIGLLNTLKPDYTEDTSCFVFMEKYQLRLPFSEVDIIHNTSLMNGDK